MLGVVLMLVLGVEGDHVRFEALGMNVHVIDGALVVSRVVADGPAARAGLVVGARIVAVRGVPVETLEQLERLLDPARGVRAVELTVETDDPPERAHDEYRLALMTIGHQFTTVDEVRSAWVGLYGAYAVAPQVWGVVGFGYIAVGLRPGFGKDGFSPLVGGEYELTLPFEWMTAFTRVLFGVNLERGVGSPGAPGEVAAISAFGHLGVRLAGVLEVGFAAGHGPGEGLNVGMVAGIGVTGSRL